MKIVGFVMHFGEGKTKCTNCNRTHARSFVVEHDDGTKGHYGSGCVKKLGLDQMEMARAFSKLSVQSARLSYDLVKDFNYPPEQDEKELERNG